MPQGIRSNVGVETIEQRQLRVVTTQHAHNGRTDVADDLDRVIGLAAEELPANRSPASVLIDRGRGELLLDLYIDLDETTRRIVLGGSRASGMSKRLFDLIVVLVLMPIWLPVLVVLCLAVIATSRGPALYTHKRVGWCGRDLRCTKLRTMVVDSDLRLELLLATDANVREEFETSYKLKNDPRVTRLGQLLRCTGLDELPQLFRVITGEMSLVGPRPVTQAEADRYGEYRPIVESQRPGLTGLWQVSGRNDVSYSERIALDVQYALCASIGRDLKIVASTALRVFRVSTGGAY
ncbi:MAG: sugar transferase [Acidimicrobiia bacterium]|nr:sugar transferase [Acidimicrobiia bacterium]